MSETSTEELKSGLSVGGNALELLPGDGKRSPFSLRIADAYDLPKKQRELLRPWEYAKTRTGYMHRLPRFFYEVPSWETCRDTRLTDHFDLWEFLDVDLQESRELHGWPRYVPCAVTLLAAQLELLREELRTYIHISANGGYRTPAHALSTHASTHCWGTAVNIHRIGDDLLDDARTIERYAAIARQVMPGVYVRPYGSGVGEADDHLHIDLGYVEVVPHNISEAFEMKEDAK
jgi:hypothetical protein